MRKIEKGFTLVELAVAVAVTGVIAVSAFGSYKYYIPKAQFSESMKMMNAEVPNVLSANAISACTTTGANQTVKGKYGVLTVAGTFKKVSGQSCHAGCTLSYKFNATDVSKNLAGKTVAANVTAGGQLSKTTATNVDASFVPDRFKAIAIASGDSCTTLTDGSLTATNGTLSGTDKATTAAVPTNPLTPTEQSGSMVDPLVAEVALAKTFNYSVNYQINRSGDAAGMSVGIVFPKGVSDEFINENNWTMKSDGVFYLGIDRGNSGWSNYWNAYSYRWSGPIAVHTRSNGESYCAEGGGCSGGYEYYGILEIYYKGVLIGKFDRSGFPEAYSG